MIDEWIALRVEYTTTTTTKNSTEHQDNEIFSNIISSVLVVWEWEYCILVAWNVINEYHNHFDIVLHSYNWKLCRFILTVACVWVCSKAIDVALTFNQWLSILILYVLYTLLLLFTAPPFSFSRSFPLSLSSPLSKHPLLPPAFDMEDRLFSYEICAFAKFICSFWNNSVSW